MIPPARFCFEKSCLAHCTLNTVPSAKREGGQEDVSEAKLAQIRPSGMTGGSGLSCSWGVLSVVEPHFRVASLGKDYWAAVS